MQPSTTDSNEGTRSPRPNDTPSAIVLVIDRLTAGSLGPYGNTSIDTPELNRWAAAGVLFDQVIANSIDLNQVYDSWWNGGHRDDTSLKSNASLFTDDPKVAAHPGVDQFDQVQLSESPESSQPEGPADLRRRHSDGNIFCSSNRSACSFPSGITIVAAQQRHEPTLGRADGLSPKPVWPR